MEFQDRTLCSLSLGAVFMLVLLKWVMFFLNKDYAAVSCKIMKDLDVPCGIPLFSTLGSIT